MKQSAIITCCIIIVSSLLTASLLLQPALPVSKNTSTPALSNTFQSTPLSSPEGAPTSTSSPKTSATPSDIILLPAQTITQSTPQSHAVNRTLQDAIGNATNYLVNAQEPYALLNLNILYRQYGIQEFASSLNKYDRQLTISQPNLPMLQLFRRIADYSNIVSDDNFDEVTYDVDKITIPALYSDRRSLPSDYPAMLNEYANGGEYLTTHALLAVIWLKENNCTLALPDNFTTSLYHGTSALINNDSIVSDLEIEAAALLYEAGQGSLVDSSFIQHVIAAQNVDGGWSMFSDTSTVSYWHTSVLALMLLLPVAFHHDSYPPMLAPPS